MCHGVRARGLIHVIREHHSARLNISIPPKNEPLSLEERKRKSFKVQTNLKIRSLGGKKATKEVVELASLIRDLELWLQF